MNTVEISSKVAAAILCQKGEISFEDIKCLPFLAGPNESDDVIRSLLRNFDVDVRKVKNPAYPVHQWETVIRLRECSSPNCIDPCELQR